MRRRTSTAATITPAPVKSPVSTLTPPADQASTVGGIATSTVASPPSATKPMIPTLNSPANPHCRLTPRLITAETSPMLRINSAVPQLCITPVSTISSATTAKRPKFFKVWFIPISPGTGPWAGTAERSAGSRN